MSEPVEQEGRWVVAAGLSGEELVDYVAELKISQDQVIAVTEPAAGQFTLVYAGTREQAVNRVARAAAQVADAARIIQELRQGQENMSARSDEELEEIIRRGGEAT